MGPFDYGGADVLVPLLRSIGVTGLFLISDPVSRHIATVVRPLVLGRCARCAGYYDNLPITRSDGFVVQTGDPDPEGDVHDFFPSGSSEVLQCTKKHK